MKLLSQGVKQIHTAESIILGSVYFSKYIIIYFLYWLLTFTFYPKCSTFFSGVVKLEKVHNCTDSVFSVPGQNVL